MRPVLVLQAVDQDDPVSATLVRWAKALAEHPDIDGVTVLTLRAGRYDLPANVAVRELGTGRMRRLARFYAEVVRAIRRREADFFFVAQGGPYPILLLPVRAVTGRSVYQWKTHRHVNRETRFAARYCDDLVFTATRRSFPLDLPNIRAVGHGIDTDVFRPLPVPASGRRDLVAVGLVNPVKRLELVVRAVAAYRDTCGRAASLDLYGPTLDADRAYRDRLERLVDDLGLGDQVRFCGPLSQDDMPKVLSGYRAGISFAAGALDKSMIEAMACGLPVISSNPCLAEILPDDLRARFIVADDEPGAVATAIAAALDPGPDVDGDLGERMRAIVVDHHDLAHFWDRILVHVKGLA